MIGFFNLPNKDNNFKVFYTNGVSNSWQVWHKPKNAKYVYLFVLGSGAGGSSGNVGGANTTLRGGGGGGSAAFTRGLFLANLLPDILYIQVGAGGAGNVSGNGSNGALSYVSAAPDSTYSIVNIVLASGAVAPTGGQVAAAGAAGTIFAQTAGLLSYLGTIQATAGQIGLIGGSGAIGASQTITLPITAGASGGGSATGVGYAGGDITGAGIIPTILGGQTTGSSGENGITLLTPSINASTRNPMFFTGGAGGAGNNNGAGGKGGDGSFGCGGAGGGSGTTGSGAGAGGRGGDGLIIITTW